MNRLGLKKDLWKSIPLHIRLFGDPVGYLNHRFCNSLFPISDELVEKIIQLKEKNK